VRCIARAFRQIVHEINRSLVDVVLDVGVDAIIAPVGIEKMWELLAASDIDQGTTRVSPAHRVH
jgi:hypothetical protein